MTPEQAREIDRLEFEAEAQRIRNRALAMIQPQARTKSHARPAPVTTSVTTPMFNSRAVGRPHRVYKARLHTVDGVSLSLSGWAKRLGISTVALAQRTRRRGSLAAAVAMGPKRGVVLNFPDPKGTGAGSIAQDIPEIEFSE